MQINITLDGGEGPHELNALAALIASLGGRAPTVNPIMPELRPNVPDTGTSSNGAASPSPDIAPTSDADEPVDTGAPDRDSAGLPWDARIHSASKATVADGTWRRRKNTPDETYDAVMAELRGGSAAPDPTPSSSTDDTPPPPVEPAATETPVAAAASASEDVPPPPADSGPDLSSFPKFVSAVNNKDVPAERKAYAALNELCATFGVAAFKDMKDHPEHWAMFYDMVG
jgi:hypothetical protein